MSGVEHHYGERVRISDSPYLASLLARMGSPEPQLLETIQLLRSAYRVLLAEALAVWMPTVDQAVTTRMAALHAEHGVWHGRALDPASRVVVVDVIRGGILPSQEVFEQLNQVLSGENLRLDHLNMSRRTDSEERVVGVDLSGSKIGGDVTGATLLMPDPMGATGSTVVEAVRHYEESFGSPAQVLCLPLIATPEFLRRVLDEVPGAIVHAGRVDRGLSPAEVLQSTPGEHWEQERGLDDRSYIVPGAGGMGELLNNSWC